MTHLETFKEYFEGLGANVEIDQLPYEHWMKVNYKSKELEIRFSESDGSFIAFETVDFFKLTGTDQQDFWSVINTLGLHFNPMFCLGAGKDVITLVGNTNYEVVFDHNKLVAINSMYHASSSSSVCSGQLTGSQKLGHSFAVQPKKGCDCGARAVGVTDQQIELHAHYCYLRGNK